MEKDPAPMERPFGVFILKHLIDSVCSLLSGAIFTVIDFFLRGA
jgi:hypothetical protein